MQIVFPYDLCDQLVYFFDAPLSYDEQTIKKFWKEETPKIVADCLEIINKTEPFTSINLEGQIKKYIEGNELGFGKVMNPLRLAVVGAAKGPHLFDIFEMIGKEETIARIEQALKEIRFS